jgi:hypothetical protein
MDEENNNTNHGLSRAAKKRAKKKQKQKDLEGPTLGSDNLMEPSSLIPTVQTSAEMSSRELNFEENSVDHQHRSQNRSAFLKYFMVLLPFLFIISLKRFGVLENDFRIEDVTLQDFHPNNVFSRINDSIPLAYLTQEKKRPGYLMAERGATAKYPIVLIPGFVTSGLEVWSGFDCTKAYFRLRLWADMTGTR